MNLKKYFSVVLLLIFSQSLFAGDVFVYISLRNENKIAIYKLDTLSGNLQLVEKFTVSGGPASVAIDSAKKHLYISQRLAKTISSFTIDPVTGKLTFLNTIAAVDDPVNLDLDRKNNFLLTVYYAANKAAIYPVDDDGSVITPAVNSVITGTNPHAIHTDPSNRFLYISNKTGDKIQLYQFNAATGDISPSTPVEYVTPASTGPRHFVFHSNLDLVYFSNETGNSVSVYEINQTTGILSHLQTVSTLPASFTGVNTVADIHFTPDEKFLYVSNRGHNSIAAFSVNSTDGLLTSINQYATASTPRAFDIDPTGNFLFAAGETSDDLASYRINISTGVLSSLGTYLSVGDAPVWVMAVKLDNVINSISRETYKETSSFTFSPNPHSAASVFSFELTSTQPVNVSIFNANGSLVRTLSDTSLSAGKHSLLWDGADNSNSKVPAGVYTACFRTPRMTESIKVVVP